MIGSYMYFFRFKETSFCIDATHESGRMGRLINHSIENKNVAGRIMEYHRSPRLVFFATRRIEEGEEILYDYSERRKTVIDSNPWLGKNNSLKV